MIYHNACRQNKVYWCSGLSLEMCSLLSDLAFLSLASYHSFLGIQYLRLKCGDYLFHKTSFYFFIKRAHAGSIVVLKQALQT